MGRPTPSKSQLREIEQKLSALEERFNEIEHNQNIKHSNPINPEPKYKLGMTLYEFWTFIVGAVTGLATVIIVGIAVRQFFDNSQTDLARAQIEAMKEQSRIMDKQYKAENSTFLVLKNTIPEFTPGRKLRVQFDFLNVGTATIAIVSSKRSFCISCDPKTLIEGMGKVKADSGNIYVAPKDIYRTILPDDINPLVSERDLEIVKEDNPMFWTCGEINYINLSTNEKLNYRFLCKYYEFWRAKEGPLRTECPINATNSINPADPAN